MHCAPRPRLLRERGARCVCVWALTQSSQSVQVMVPSSVAEPSSVPSKVTLIADGDAFGIVRLIGASLSDLDHDEVGAFGLDQRQLVVRLADDVVEAAGFAGAVDIGGFDRDGLLAGVERQRRVCRTVCCCGALFGRIVWVLGRLIGVACRCGGRLVRCRIGAL